MARPRDEDDEMITGINVTPLVDIVLVLLIVLMVTAAYAASKAIPMELPVEGPGEADEAPALAVSVDASSHLYVNGEPVTWPELAQRARAFAEEQRFPRAVIQADRASSHGDFVRVVDTLRTARIQRYGVLVEEP